MSKVAIVHWKPEEGRERADSVRRAGFDGSVFTPEGGNLKPLRESPPDIIVIDLTRLPSHGAAVGSAFRRYKSTRHTPLIFAGGTPEVVGRVRSLLPDAVFTPWERIMAALANAASSQPVNPIAPGPMAGYSGTPINKKLGIKPNSTLTLIDPPDDYPERLGLTEDIIVHSRPGRPSQRVLLFIERFADLENRFAAAEKSTIEGGGLWIVWPKRASGVRTDVSEKEIRRYALEAGWVDYKICAVDEKWSGLLFARRK